MIVLVTACACMGLQLSCAISWCMQVGGALVAYSPMGRDINMNVTIDACMFKVCPVCPQRNPGPDPPFGRHSELLIAQSVCVCACVCVCAGTGQRRSVLWQRGGSPGERVTFVICICVHSFQHGLDLTLAVFGNTMHHMSCCSVCACFYACMCVCLDVCAGCQFREDPRLAVCEQQRKCCHTVRCGR